jgi:RNA-directed DNA polymerase
MPSVSLPSFDEIQLIREEFKAIKNPKDFVRLLNTVEREIVLVNSKEKPKPILTRHLYFLARPSNRQYTSFTIPKKNGGLREIEAPEPFLKRVQAAINATFQILFFDKTSYHNNGFTLKRGILRNASIHTRKRFVLSIDIENYFPSIEFRRIKKMLEFDPFSLVGESEQVGFLIANIAVLDGRLAQGAPTSPVMSNIVSQRLDRKLAAFANEKKIKYSRYADDLAFSSNRKIFNKKLIAQIFELIEEENFKVNKAKTRLKSNRDRQEVTGLIVNEGVNISRNYLKKVRTMVNNWEKGGLKFATNQFAHHEQHNQYKDFKNVLNGRISYVGLVKGKDNQVFLKLKRRYALLKNRVEYEKIGNAKVKETLIRDNEKMERILLDSIHSSEGKFISFCTSAFHQIENLVNYFYWTRFPKFEDLLIFLLDKNPAFKKRFKTLDGCKKFQHIGQLDINVLIYLFEKEFYFDKGIAYKQELTMLRDIRNDDSHRCIVSKFDQDLILKDYEKLKIKWENFRRKHGRFPIKPMDEEEIEYRYRLLQFLREQRYNVVRSRLRQVASQVQTYLLPVKANI